MAGDVLAVKRIAQDECGFDAALGGAPALLCTEDGRGVALAVPRWHQPANKLDQWMLNRCIGPTIDLGCGPGRLVAALLARGIPALGIDHSPHAGHACLADRDAVLQRDVFAPLPNEGTWSHVLLADANIGIGGDPTALLRRCVRLLAPAGSVLLELEPPGTGLWQGRAQLRYPSLSDQPGPWFSWAQVGLDALDELAAPAGLRVGTHYNGSRCFAQLHVSP